MKRAKWILMTAAMLALSACKQEPKIVSLGGAPDSNIATIARVREGSMFIRGIDRKRLEPGEIQNPFSDFVYAMTPGKHELLAMNIQSGHLLPMENMRCYIIEADFKAGVLYRLNEDKARQMALLVREDNGAEVASGKMVGQSTAFGNPCHWK